MALASEYRSDCRHLRGRRVEPAVVARRPLIFPTLPCIAVNRRFRVSSRHRISPEPQCPPKARAPQFSNIAIPKLASDFASKSGERDARSPPQAGHKKAPFILTSSDRSPDETTSIRMLFPVRLDPNPPSLAIRPFRDIDKAGTRPTLLGRDLQQREPPVNCLDRRPTPGLIEIQIDVRCERNLACIMQRFGLSCRALWNSQSVSYNKPSIVQIIEGEYCLLPYLFWKFATYNLPARNRCFVEIENCGV